MRTYFDASVLTALAVPEPSMPGILHWLGQNARRARPSFSDFGRGEVASAFGRRVRTGEFTIAAAYDALLALDVELVLYEQETALPEDIELARTFVLRFDLALRLPDAIHIAIASRLGATLVSLDKRQLAGARSLGIAAADPLA